MKLNNIRDYVKQRNQCSLIDIALHFDISEAGAEFAINYWVQQQKIREVSKPCSATCNDCYQGKLYQWVQQEIPIQFFNYKK